MDIHDIVQNVVFLKKSMKNIWVPLNSIDFIS